MAMATMPAIILAADRGPNDPVARYVGAASKCLVPVAGIGMLERVVATLSASPWIGRIIVVHNSTDDLMGLETLARLFSDGRLELVPAEPTPSLSTLRGIEACGGDFPLLVTTADHPLLTSEMIDHFCAQAVSSDVDVAAGVVPATLIRDRFPEAKRTYLRFRDDGYSGANLFAILNPNGKKAVVFWRQVEAQRKKPWRIARVFGWRLLIGYLVRAWALDTAISLAAARIGVKAQAVKLPFAEAAIDVDKPDDLDLAEKLLSRAR